MTAPLPRVLKLIHKELKEQRQINETQTHLLVKLTEMLNSEKQTNEQRFQALEREIAQFKEQTQLV